VTTRRVIDCGKDELRMSEKVIKAQSAVDVGVGVGVKEEWGSSGLLGSHREGH
jgi:hypothetical protein